MPKRGNFIRRRQNEYMETGAQVGRRRRRRRKAFLKLKNVKVAQLRWYERRT
jgi:hypothetical protein